ncbi:MAG: GNAT family N-acetyltransferase [Acidimicrobiales bacterium]
MTGELDRLDFRELRTADELAHLPPFEARIWGSGGDLVSVNMLVATIGEGGVALGAFDGDEIVGAVYGFATREPHVLHSHYMAVDPRWRRNGLGVELKQRQRRWCLERGITHMRWTYDPLQLANAHLNLHVLGCVGVAYHVDYYGHLGGINGSLPSDRVMVSWDLREGATKPAAELAVDVPPAGADDIAASNDTALTARLHVRAELHERMSDGWVLVDVDRDGRRYLLARG